MHIHILGICGTFMGGVAALAKAKGFRVTGSDQNVYPPMSTQLEALGIELIQGYDPSQLSPRPDMVVIGNAMSRGNPCVEYVLEHGLNYMSGPEWLKQHVLNEAWVLAVSGTHGKTTTASMLAWILEFAGLKPGFLIGGIVQNFGSSARLGETPFFVIEADEYDTAFFDKRSKFVHYKPRTLILNNLEFDHADIFENLSAIEKQFHHLLRIVPGQGKVIYPDTDEALLRVLAKGCWSEVERLGQDWSYRLIKPDGSEFEVFFKDQSLGQVCWQAIGEHNVKNAMMAIAAARHVGVSVENSIEALAGFISPKRRMECIADIHGVHIYDDFAHHPTAIKTTLAGLRAKVGNEKIYAVLEPRSNTMKMGVHKDTLSSSLQDADETLLFQPDNLSWSFEQLQSREALQCYSDTDKIVEYLVDKIAANEHVVIMSNGGFNGIHNTLVNALKNRASTY